MRGPHPTGAAGLEMSFKLEEDPLHGATSSSHVLNLGKLDAQSTFQRQLKECFETGDCRSSVPTLPAEALLPAGLRQH